MSTNYGKQIAKNKGAVIATFAVAFLATYAVMGNGGAQSDDLSAAVVVSGTPTITSAMVSAGEAGAGNYLSVRGSGFSDTNNLIVVCRVITASGNCDSKPNTTMYLSNVKPYTDTRGVVLYAALPTKYSSGAPVVASAKHRVYVLNNTTKKVSNAITLSSLVSPATPQAGSLSLALNANTPPAAEVICTEGPSANECNKVPMFSFNLKAEKQNITVTGLTLGLIKHTSAPNPNGRLAIPWIFYLYDGDTEIANETVNSAVGDIVFDAIDEIIPKDTTKTYTVKVGVRNADISTVYSLTLSSSKIVTSNKGDTRNGSASSNKMTFRNVGPVFTLMSKSIQRYVTTDNQISTTTVQATFNVKVKAIGGDIIFGTVASRTPMFGSSSPYFVTYVNGAQRILNVASSTDFSVPSSGVMTAGLNNSFILSEQNEITIPVTFTFISKTSSGREVLPGSNSVAIGLERIAWIVRGNGYPQFSIFMAGDSDWRSKSVTIPW